jgi:hypothetical protein
MNGDRRLKQDTLQSYGIEIVSNLEATKASVNDRKVQTTSWREKLISQQQRNEPTLLRA